MYLNYLAATEKRQLRFNSLLDNCRKQIQTPKIAYTEMLRTSIPEKISFEIAEKDILGIEVHEIKTVAEITTHSIFVKIQTYVTMVKERIVYFFMNCNSAYRHMATECGTGFTVSFGTWHPEIMEKGSDLKPACSGLAEKEEKYLSREEGSLCLSETQTKMIRVLKFLREFTHVTAREVADLMEGEFNSRSYLAAVENGLRTPSPEYITDYAKALQKALKIKKDMMYVVQKCIEDPELLNLMDQYERKKGDFLVSYKIAGKIIEIDAPKYSKEK